MDNNINIPLENNSDYTINGVRYSVASHFLTPKESKVTVLDKIKNILGSDFIDLTNNTITNTLNYNVCSTAGKED